MEAAAKEIAALIAADDHPNVVRCFGTEADAHFVYLALERCARSLQQRVEAPSVGDAPLVVTAAAASAVASPATTGVGRHPSTTSPSLTPSLLPTSAALSLGEDVVRGLAWLHGLGIVHRDLKPANVLVTAAGRAKLSDMGLCKRLGKEQSSFTALGGGAGTAGWAAPEVLLAVSSASVSPSASPSSLGGRQTRAVDAFSLGLVLFYVLTGGR